MTVVDRMDGIFYGHNILLNIVHSCHCQFSIGLYAVVSVPITHSSAQLGNHQTNNNLPLGAAQTLLGLVFSVLMDLLTYCKCIIAICTVGLN